jgi:hypothetical protein
MVFKFSQTYIKKILNSVSTLILKQGRAQLILIEHLVFQNFNGTAFENDKQ